MTTLNISLPEHLTTFVEAQVAGGPYFSAGDYVCELIRRDQCQHTQAELEAKLVEALDSRSLQEVTPEFFERLRARVGKGSRLGTGSEGAV